MQFQNDKYHRKAAAVGASDPAGGAYSAPPDPLAGFDGAASRWEGKEKDEGK